MAIDQKLHNRIKAIAQELRREVYGASGTPTWGTKFTEIEDLGVEIGDLVAREVFRQAEQDLKHLAELDISEQRIARATKRIGQERVAERKAEEAAWEALSLPEQQGSPREQVP